MKKFFFNKGAASLCALLLAVGTSSMQFVGSWFLFGEPELPKELQELQK